MTPKEKAAELFKAHYSAISGISLSSIAVIGKLLKRSSLDYKEAKQCALITINEMLEYTKEDAFPMAGATGYDYDYILLDIKAEIEKL